jgi:hypothetical protein
LDGPAAPCYGPNAAIDGSINTKYLYFEYQDTFVAVSNSLGVNIGFHMTPDDKRIEDTIQIKGIRFNLFLFYLKNQEKRSFRLNKRKN